MDVADLAVLQGLVFVIGYAHADVANRLADLQEADRIRIALGRVFVRLADLQAVAVHENPRILAAQLRKRHRQGCFCESVDREHGRALQAERRHCVEELLAQVPGDRFGAVQDQFDGRQVEPLDAFAREQLEEVLVAEIGRAQLRGSKFRRFLHPQQRPAHEDVGIHDGVVHACSHGAQVIADQAHVMGERHPAQAALIFVPLDAFVDRLDIGGQVIVGQADALRVARGTRRILDEGDAG